jgi:hypothetical protein
VRDQRCKTENQRREIWDCEKEQESVRGIIDKSIAKMNFNNLIYFLHIYFVFLIVINNLI